MQRELIFMNIFLYNFEYQSDSIFFNCLCHRRPLYGLTSQAII